MKNFTTQQRIIIVKTYYENGSSISSTRRELSKKFGLKEMPSINCIRNLINKFEEHGTVTDTAKPGRPKNVRSPTNISKVLESAQDNPGMSIRRRSKELDISQTSLQRILKLDLHMKPYKIQLVQELKVTDHQNRFNYSNSILSLHAQNADFIRKLIMSDEAHFHLNGYVNKQNCRIWGTENPFSLCESPSHPSRLTVWCGIWAGGVLGPYFFEDDDERTVTVNGDEYRKMINIFLAPQLKAQKLVNMWFQQDGATCHTAKATMAILKSLFPGRLISKSGEIGWPPRSPDLTAPDFFLWGYLKDIVYCNKPRTLMDLKQYIQSAILDISPDLCQKVMENVMKRARQCQVSRGGHLENIIFAM